MRSFVEYIRSRLSLNQMIIDIYAIFVFVMRRDDFEVENKVAIQFRMNDVKNNNRDKEKRVYSFEILITCR